MRWFTKKSTQIRGSHTATTWVWVVEFKRVTP